MTYDAADHSVVAFGGCTDFYCYSVSSDTWEFVGGRWTNLSLPVHPSARSHAAITYDAKDGYVLLFGGGILRSSSYSDTWKFAAGTWTNITSNTAPPSRLGAGMTYDSRDGYVIMFGGIGASNDTWKFSGGAWTKITPAHSPPARQVGQQLTYDPSCGCAVLFGGVSSVLLNDTWTFRGGVWTNITGPTSPSPRDGAAMTYDGADGYVILFGGDTYSSLDSATWYLTGGTWHELGQSASLPPSRVPSATIDPGLTYDARDGYALMFGGLGSNGPTWTYLGGVWTVPSPVYVNWTLDWKAQTTTNFVNLGCYLGRCWGVGSTASIQALVNISVVDVTPGVAHSRSFGSSINFVLISNYATSSSPAGGMTSDWWVDSGGVIRNHTYLVESRVTVLMAVAGATYTSHGKTYSLSASASFQLISSSRGGLNWLSIP